MEMYSSNILNLLLPSAELIARGVGLEMYKAVE